MFNKTVKELSNGLANGEFSSVEITQAYLDRIKKYDGKINSFINFSPLNAWVFIVQTQFPYSLLIF